MSDENAAPDQPIGPSESSPEIRSSNPVSPPASPPPQLINEIKNVKKDRNGYKRSTLRLTWIVVIVNALTCIFIGLQWHEMKSGSSDTHTLAEAAKKQAEKMTNVSDAADKIGQAAQSMVVQDQRIADNAQRAIEASNKQGMASLRAAIDASQLDQRAWLGVWIGHTFPINGDTKIRTEIEFVNTGRTPAIHVKQAASRFVWQTPLLPGPTQNIIKDFVFHPGTPIPPQAKMTISAEESVQTLGDDYAAIKNGTKIFYFVGEIRYDDIFGKPHKTQFCLYRAHPEDQVMAACEGFNNID